MADFCQYHPTDGLLLIVEVYWASPEHALLLTYYYGVRKLGNQGGEVGVGVGALLPFGGVHRSHTVVICADLRK